MARSALPQNYIVSEGTIIESFETLGEWIKEGTGTIAADTAHVKVGSASLSLTGTNGAEISGKKVISLDMSDSSRCFYLWVYCADVSKVASMVVYFGNDANLANNYRKTILPANLTTGWTQFVIFREEWTANGSPSWGEPMIRFKVALYSVAGQTATVSVDSAYGGRRGLPRCIVAFDDGDETNYDVAWPLLNARGIPGTFYVVTDWVGTGHSMGLADLQTMYAAGSAICNHTDNHTTLTGLSESVQLEHIQDGKAWLDAHGFGRTSGHIAYPTGGYDVTTLGVFDQLQLTTGRQSVGYLYYPWSDIRLLPSKPLTPAISLATARSYVDYAIRNDTTVVLLVHALNDAPTGSDWYIDRFTSLLDYIVASRIKCITIDEWYEGLTNPRYQSLPVGRT